MSFRDEEGEEEEEEAGFRDEEENNEEENEEEESTRKFEPSHKIMEKKMMRDEERTIKPKVTAPPPKEEAEKKPEEKVGTDISAYDIGEQTAKAASKTLLDELPSVISDEIKKISKDAVLEHIKSIQLLSKMKYYSNYKLDIVPICLDLFDEFNKRLVAIEEYRMRRDISAPIKSLYTMQQETMRNLMEFRRLYMDIVPFMASSIVDEIKRKLKEEGIYKNNNGQVTSDVMDRVLEGVARIVLDVVGQEAANLLKKSGIAESMANMIIQAGYQKLAESAGQNNVALNILQSRGAQSSQSSPQPQSSPQSQAQLDSPADVYKKLKEKRNNNHGGESSPSS